mmetsp:Transcript_56112/g.114721  ORF Transcript_56112/g.114721 Transcript_56112/m.114721 type:complete len:97 (+) Transcript_56112:1124-1414(+)
MKHQEAGLRVWSCAFREKGCISCFAASSCRARTKRHSNVFAKGITFRKGNKIDLARLSTTDGVDEMHLCRLCAMHYVTAPCSIAAAWSMGLTAKRL